MDDKTATQRRTESNFPKDAARRHSQFKKDTPESQWPRWNKFKEKSLMTMDHWIYILFSTVFVLFALFADDLRQITATINTDIIYYDLILIVFCFFCVEIILNAMVRPDYFLGFIFWLDVLSTLSMLLDVGFISEKIFPTSGTNITQATRSSITFTRAARASKIGSRAGRIIRILRLIRMARIVKLYKLSDQANLQSRAIDKITEIKKTKENRDSVFNNNTGNDQDRSVAGFAKMTTMMQKKKKATFAPNKENENHSQKDKKVSLREELSVALDFDRRNFASPRKSVDVVSNVDEERSTHTIKGSMNKGLAHGSTPESSIFSISKRSNTKLAREFESKGHRPTSFGEIVPEKRSEEDIEATFLRPKDNPASANEFTDFEKKTEAQVDKETNVGKRLSDMTTKRVVIIVLLLMLSIVIFSTDTYLTRYSNYQFGLMMLYNTVKTMGNNTAEANAVFDYIIKMIEPEPENLISLTLNFIYDDNNSTTLMNHTVGTNDDFRDNEIKAFTYPDDIQINDYSAVLFIETTYFENCSAAFSIARTLFICIVLAGAALLLSQDVMSLVLAPVENMLQVINSIKENPLNAVRIEEEQALIEEGFNDERLKEKDREKEIETTIIEKIVLKIGALLAIGFGEAGSEIIVQNINHSGQINPLIPGKKVLAIFGFCDIRNFTDCTEILQERVMTFVNDIAEIVHSTVDKYAGSANKNIGDAFLLVWKFDPECFCEDSKGNIGFTNSPKIGMVANLSIVSFVKIMMKLNQSRVIEKYNRDPSILSRIKNFKVKMGFGLNAGWAIEGAIGSEYKIDASYLSPNVNMASRLEAATKQFGVPLLISDKLVNICSEEMRKLLRKIDKVTVKGSTEPIELYTFDGNFGALVLDAEENNQQITGIERKRARFKARTWRKTFYQRVFSGEIKTEELLSKTRDFKDIRKFYIPEFFMKWDIGFDYYIKGKWREAKHYFEQTKFFISGIIDGPSTTLLDYMEQLNYTLPSDWDGYRVLVEK